MHSALELDEDAWLLLTSLTLRGWRVTVLSRTPIGSSGVLVRATRGNGDLIQARGAVADVGAKVYRAAQALA